MTVVKVDSPQLALLISFVSLLILHIAFYSSVNNIIVTQLHLLIALKMKKSNNIN